MKVSLRSLLRRRSTSPEAPPASAAALPIPAKLLWSEDGVVREACIERQAGRQEVRVLGEQAPIVGEGVWLAQGDRGCEPALVTGVRGDVGQVSLELSRFTELDQVEGWGAARLSWIDSNGLMEGPGSLRSAEGSALEANAARAVPVGELALIRTAASAALARCVGCRPYGSRYLLELETISES